MVRICYFFYGFDLKKKFGKENFLMSHFTLQCHKLPLLLWPFAENIPSKSLFCVKSCTCDHCLFPEEFNGLCWVQYPVRSVPTCYLFTHTLSHSLNTYLLKISHMPGSVLSWSFHWTGTCCGGLFRHHALPAQAERMNAYLEGTKEHRFGRQAPKREASGAS